MHQARGQRLIREHVPMMVSRVKAEGIEQPHPSIYIYIDANFTLHH